MLAVLSEILVGSIKPFIETFGLSEFFVGVILIPTIGNLAEHIVAVQLAFKNKMEFAMAVSFGSSLQVALFVGPVLVLLGLVVGQPMNLVFGSPQTGSIQGAARIPVSFPDGTSNTVILSEVYGTCAKSNAPRASRPATVSEPKLCKKVNPVPSTWIL